ncbi:hypothetical protein [Mesorhizobium sp.]|uniref:hypothetical protein n=1 Tax=Mesorhizobium sp. TaxID=1871066 RepID=UPI000FE8AD42|nr:hypothetical protein [Mesorhizobium sp.]RWP31770.1 MAG: hypothetical protein EOR02_08110 [Mesorhizobium sp.]TIL29989.1 MAG: hypothetical protein E5Y85_25500 [Mesorhizobium sp.]
MNKQKLMSALQAELNRQFEYGAIMYHPDMGGQPMISYPIVYPAPRPVIDLERLADAVLGALALAHATTKTAYAHEYGKSNGDGTFSVVIERGDPEKPVSDWPIMPLFSSGPTPSPDKVLVTEAMVEIAAKAIDDAEFGFTLNLTRLVDGVSTYTLTYSDGSPPLEFGATDEAYEHVAQRKRLTLARAALTAALGAGSGAEHG